jgi:hypothetical protein
MRELSIDEKKAKMPKKSAGVIILPSEHIAIIVNDNKAASSFQQRMMVEHNGIMWLGLDWHTHGHDACGHG